MANNNQTDQYKMVLKLANIILKHSNNPPITDLLDFKMIERKHIVKKEVNDEFRTIIDEFYTHFDKHKTCFYKKDLPTWTFLTLKKSIGQLGFKIEISKKAVSVKVNGISMNYKGSFYSILLKE